MGDTTEPDRSTLGLVRRAYEKAHIWVVQGSVLLVVAVLYFGEFLGPAESILLPAAVGIIAVFVVQSLQNIERQTGPAVPDDSYPSVAAAIPVLETLVARDRDVTDIKVIAATGWTTVRQVVPALCQSSPARRIQLELHVVDGSGPFRDMYPDHWHGEVQRTITRARQQFADPRFTMDMSAYSYLPVLHGILINEKYLLLGFFGWADDAGSPELSGAERPHRLYRDGDAASGPLFAAFREWFDRGPRSPILTLPDARGGS